MGRPATATISPESLDLLLNKAQDSFGLSVQTTNARRLLIMLRGRIRQHQQQHPAAFTALALLTSRSPLEIYIVNKERANEWRQRGDVQAPNPHTESPLREAAGSLPD